MARSRLTVFPRPTRDTFKHKRPDLDLVKDCGDRGGVTLPHVRMYSALNRGFNTEAGGTQLGLRTVGAGTHVGRISSRLSSFLKGD